MSKAVRLVVAGLLVALIAGHGVAVAGEPATPKQPRQPGQTKPPEATPVPTPVPPAAPQTPRATAAPTPEPTVVPTQPPAAVITPRATLITPAPTPAGGGGNGPLIGLAIVVLAAIIAFFVLRRITRRNQPHPYDSMHDLAPMPTVDSPTFTPSAPATEVVTPPLDKPGLASEAPPPVPPPVRPPPPPAEPKSDEQPSEPPEAAAPIGKPVENDPARGAEDQTCPHCGRTVPAGFRFCDGCGRLMTAPPTS